MKKYLLILFFSSSVIHAQTWNNQLVNSGWILDPRSVFFGQNNEPIIFYQQSNTLMISFWNGASWNTRPILSGWTISNVVKEDSLYHVISLSTYDLSGIHYIIRQDGSIKGYYFVGQCGYSPQLIVGPTNYVTLIYGGGPLNTRKYNISEQTWSSAEIVDGSSSLSKPSLAMSLDGTIWLAYQENLNKHIKIARSIDSGGWDNWFVDTSHTAYSTVQLQVINNTAHITYYDVVNKKLLYATFKP